MICIPVCDLNRLTTAGRVRSVGRALEVEDRAPGPLRLCLVRVGSNPTHPIPIQFNPDPLLMGMMGDYSAATRDGCST